MATDFCGMYACQENFQRLLLKNEMYGNTGYSEIPYNNVKLFSYHMQAMISELGEVLEADKRWKSFRNAEYDRKCKLEEIADCFLTMMNVAIFSGYQSYEVEEAICKKVMKNFERVKKELEENKT